jgi:hypothetical protein
METATSASGKWLGKVSCGAMGTCGSEDPICYRTHRRGRAGRCYQVGAYDGKRHGAIGTLSVSS